MAEKQMDREDVLAAVEEWYPRNLLLAAKGQTNLGLPNKITKDVSNGIRYAISMLEPEEQELLHLRYKEALPQAAAGAMLGLDGEQVRQLEAKALRKLRLPSRWNYLQYGIAGYLKKKGADEYRKGFLLGYQQGYEAGAEDARSGVVQAYADEEVLNLPIEALQLSAHPYYCLYRMGYRRIRDVAGLKETNIYKIRSLGEKSAKEIAQALQKQGVSFTAWNKYL